MQKNVGKIDRIVRASIGAVLLLLAHTVFTGWVMWLVWVCGFIALVTAVLGHCHVYTLFGFSTVTQNTMTDHTQDI